MLVNVRPCLGKLMKEKEWTQTKLSKASGVPQGTISRFDKNQRHDYSHVFSIARALGVEVKDLFEEL